MQTMAEQLEDKASQERSRSEAKLAVVILRSSRKLWIAKNQPKKGIQAVDAPRSGVNLMVSREIARTHRHGRDNN